MAELTIDNKRVRVEEGSTVLEAARSAGIHIPTFCYYETLSPYGACRLCTVEVHRKGGSWLVASCLLRAEEGMVISTNTPRVVEARKILAELLLARCPNVKEVQKLAKSFGVGKPRFRLKDERCILCGRCVRACREIVKVGAISLVNRGKEREMKSPFHTASSTCIGCGTCLYVCPTDAVDLGEIKLKETVHSWGVDFETRMCRICGEYHFAPEYGFDYEELKRGDS
ncbi:4Fe-4S dicluster domain-containing protein [candidate division TA06 bacterium]|uniref:4Fe-4S dicluster domain-containing protein n=1 Tax=candidate division TA06 bacterium TaxID=2250710 RepID=A0A523UUA2_UNCT6|nr:MAG: 4Fe-4S dicluster domain-containing protein [candidate division TA06 bacterium]